MTHQTARWILTAYERLLQLRIDDVGWGYGSQSPACTEPTAISALALLASDPTCDGHAVEALKVQQAVEQSCQWLASLQQPAGAVGVAADMPQPGWPTSIVALLWSQDPTYQRNLSQSLRWLQQQAGHTSLNDRKCGLSHDTSIPGWPWVAGTQPWLEPTAFAMLALCRSQLSGHQRVRDGIRLILDRAYPTGGWNEGDCTSQPGTVIGQADARLTGIVLLALRAAGHAETPSVTRACQFLLDTLLSEQTPESLGWGLLGLQAWRAKPMESESWLEHAFTTAAGLNNSPAALALLILAASEKALPMLGLTVVQSGSDTWQGATGMFNERTPARGGMPA